MWTSYFGLCALCWALSLHFQVVTLQTRSEGTNSGVTPVWNTPGVAWRFSNKDSHDDDVATTNAKTGSFNGLDVIAGSDTTAPTPSGWYEHRVTPTFPSFSQRDVGLTLSPSNFTSFRRLRHSTTEATLVSWKESSSSVSHSEKPSYFVPSSPQPSVTNQTVKNIIQTDSTPDQYDRRYFQKQTSEQEPERDVPFRTGYFDGFITTKSLNWERSTHNGNRMPSAGSPRRISPGPESSSQTSLDKEKTSQNFPNAGRLSQINDRLSTYLDKLGEPGQATSRTFTNAVDFPASKSTHTDNGDVPPTKSTQSDSSDLPTSVSTEGERDTTRFLTGADLDTAEGAATSPHWTNGPEVTVKPLSHLNYQQTNSHWSSNDLPSGQSNTSHNISAAGQHVESTPVPDGAVPQHLVISKTGEDDSEPGDLSNKSPSLAYDEQTEFYNVNETERSSASQEHFNDYGRNSENITESENPRKESDARKKSNKYGSESESDHGTKTESEHGVRSQDETHPEYGTHQEYADLLDMYDSGNFSYEDFFGSGAHDLDHNTDAGNATDPSEDDCLFDMFGASGRLKFPDVEHFPVSDTKEFLTCRWRVRVPEGPNIRVSFERLALSLGVETLEIAVGMDGELKKRAYTGSKVPRDLVTIGTRLWLTARVRNDNYVEKIVMSFEETAEEGVFPVKENYTCGAILSDMQGNISSPGYPLNNYSNNQECSWYLVAPSQSVIRLTVKDFSTDVYDHVTMGIGLHAGTTSSKLLTLFGHLQEQRETVIPSNSLWIRFTSDDSDTNKGFFVTYQVIPRDICNGTDILSEPEGEVTSPGYPAKYGINTECTWYIRAPPTVAYINVTINDLSLQDGRDFLLLGQGTDLFGGPFMTYTGNMTPSAPIQIETKSVWIHFTTDHLDGDGVYRGFKLSYRIVDKKSAEAILEADEEEKGDAADQENMVQPELKPQNDEGTKKLIKIPLAGVNSTQLDSKMDKFTSLVADLLSEHCAQNPGNKDKCKIRPEDVRVVSRQQGERRLVVAVSLATHTPAAIPDMASTDYEELERLFHSDLQSLDLQDEESSDKVSSHLPEWLIGVIVVVILLIVAFFAMVIYSLMKERKKNRAGSYGGTTSTGSACEDLESGKTNGTIRFTQFSGDSTDKDADATTTNGANGHAKDGANGWTLDSEAASTLQRRQPGGSGCMNPAFIDDDPVKEDDDKKESDDSKDDKDDPQNSKDGDKNASEEGKDAKDGKTAKDGKRGKSPSKSNKSPKSPKSKSPKASKSAKSTKNNNEETPAVANGELSTGKSVENGDVVTHAPPATEPKDGTTEASADNDTQSKEEDAKVAEASSEDAQPSTSGSEGGLEVMVEREVTQPQPTDEIVLQVHKEDKQSDQEHSTESSTDEKEDNTDMSTNL